jgi:BirA family biotin operon repressor/biotin-[acetyl-CoA-carboxylase] ligase
MSGILLWGTGFPGLAEETSPGLMERSASSIPNGAFDISELTPWFEFSLVCEGPQSKCWISAKQWEYPPLIMSGNCSSSLDVAWHFHRMGLLPIWSSVLALSQWAGRGQFGRTWQSPPGNMYASWRLPNPPKPWAGMLSLVVGYMIIRGLMSDGGIEVQLKWPNDLLIKGKKVGGILIEARGDVFIAGVGVNLISAPEKLQIDDPLAFSPTSLKAAVGFSVSPLALWARLVQSGQSCYHEIISCGPTTKRFISHLQPHMAFMGEEVIIDDYHGGKSGAGPYQARIVGLDQSGALLIRASGRERLIRSGRIYPLNSEGKKSQV